MSQNDDGSPFAVEEPTAAQWEDIEEAVFAELEADAPKSMRPEARRPRIWAFAAVAVLSAAAAVVVLGAGASGSGEVVSDRTSSTRFQGGSEGAELTLEDVRLGLGANARGLVVGNSDRGWVVALEEGRVEFVVAPRRDRPGFVVQASDVRVEVVGTRFFVTRQGEHVEVEVVEGIVRVTADGVARELRAGERWATEEPSSPSVVIETSEAVSVEQSAPTTRRRLSDSQVYERAAALEAQDPASAVRLYRRLARGGAWREAALFARGRLEVETGNTETGSRVLRRYLQRYPNGVNAQDARFLLGQTTDLD
ncbi:MAG: hypothetical protein ACI9KE_001951 [Polyangiales bacterium]|jgi:hypothetical protein